TDRAVLPARSLRTAPATYSPSCDSPLRPHTPRSSPSRRPNARRSTASVGPPHGSPSTASAGPPPTDVRVTHMPGLFCYPCARSVPATWGPILTFPRFAGEGTLEPSLTNDPSPPYARIEE